MEILFVTKLSVQANINSYCAAVSCIFFFQDWINPETASFALSNLLNIQNVKTMYAGQRPRPLDVNKNIIQEEIVMIYYKET